MYYLSLMRYFKLEILTCISVKITHQYLKTTICLIFGKVGMRFEIARLLIIEH